MTLPPGPGLTVDPEMQGRVRLGALVLEGLRVREGDEALAGEVAAEGEALRRRHAGASSGEVPATADARRLYKALGLDPTKVRPSNEALLRRVLKGEALFRVNTLVDALNLCSLRSQLPFGLYDLDRVRGPVVLRRGRDGEAYEGIRKGTVSVEGRPVLADQDGAFGNPTSDSARTRITLECRRALVVAYAPASHTVAAIESLLRETASTLTRHCGGAVAHLEVL